MSWLRKSGLLLLLAVWGLATVHCRLESLPGLEFLSCCQHEEAEKTPDHHQNDCADDGCVVVESGFCHQVKPLIAPAKPLLLGVTFVAPLLELELPPGSFSVALAASAPPDIPKVWQFAHRTALPPRAPSLAS